MNLIERRQQIIAAHGPWVAHNIHLGQGVYTMGADNPSDKTDARRMAQIFADIAGKPFSELRILDLACLEGLYAIEFALQGAAVVCIEGREMNVGKADFAKEALGLDRLTFYQDDVRNLSAAKYGKFDAVLCAGLLYHLDAPAVFEFLEQIAEVCTRVAIIDTHTSALPAVQTEWKGELYAGRHYMEFQPDTPQQDKNISPESSLDNNKSFWLTRPSLYNCLARVGFSSAYECVNPFYLKPGWLDRPTIVAIKGVPLQHRTSPAVAAWPLPAWPEVDRRQLHPSQANGLLPKWHPLRILRAISYRLTH